MRSLDLPFLCHCSMILLETLQFPLESGLIARWSLKLIAFWVSRNSPGTGFPWSSESVDPKSPDLTSDVMDGVAVPVDELSLGELSVDTPGSTPAARQGVATTLGVASGCKGEIALRASEVLPWSTTGGFSLLSTDGLPISSTPLSTVEGALLPLVSVTDTWSFMGPSSSTLKSPTPFTRGTSAGRMIGESTSVFARLGE